MPINKEEEMAVELNGKLDEVIRGYPISVVCLSFGMVLSLLSMHDTGNSRAEAEEIFNLWKKFQNDLKDITLMR